MRNTQIYLWVILILFANINCGWITSSDEEKYWKFSCRNKDYSLCTYYELTDHYYPKQPGCDSYAPYSEDLKLREDIYSEKDCKKSDRIVACSGCGEDYRNCTYYFYSNYFYDENNEVIPKENISLEEFENESSCEFVE